MDRQEHRTYIPDGPLLLRNGVIYNPYRWPKISGWLGLLPLQVDCYNPSSTWWPHFVSPLQGGPLPVLSEVTTPISRDITPVYPSYPFIRPFIGVITSRGTPCTYYNQKPLNIHFEAESGISATQKKHARSIALVPQQRS